eukprot:g10542.t1
MLALMYRVQPDNASIELLSISMPEKLNFNASIECLKAFLQVIENQIKMGDQDARGVSSDHYLQLRILENSDIP